MLQKNQNGANLLKKYVKGQEPYQTFSKPHTLQFYKELAEQKITLASNYILAADAFKKTKKAFDAKSGSQRTQADVDGYNKAVADMNKLGTVFNKLNEELNNNRTAVTNSWNKAVDTFMDVHMPYAR